MKIFRLLRPLLLTALTAATAAAQRGQNDWMTSAFDAQRSGWVRGDNKISVESLSKPGFELVWKVKPANAARGLNQLTPPALIDFYIGYRGFRTLGFFGASGDKVIAYDTDLARLEWEKAIGPAKAPVGSAACPGGLTSAVARPSMIAYPPVPTGGGPGRGTPARSGVGDPYAGAVTLRNVRATPPPKPAPAKPGAAAAFNPFAPVVQMVMAIAGDGSLHRFWISNGNEPEAAIPFLPAGAHARGLVVYDKTAYAATVNNCGGVPDGVWAVDLESKRVTSWKSNGKPVAGTAGPAVAPSGTLYVAAGDEIVALQPKTLEPLARYASGGAAFTSSPVVFEYRGRDLVAATTDDGRLHVVDTKTMKAENSAKSPAYSAPSYAAGSVTSWQDPSGTRWLLTATAGDAALAAGFTPNGPLKDGAIAAWKLTDRAGQLALQPAWVSRDLTSPLPPVVVNGVVFAVSSGEYRPADPKTPIAQRVQRSKPAVLYALDGATGRELWSSGSTITSFVHSGGLSVGGARVYVSGFDGTQYAFGFPIEH